MVLKFSRAFLREFYKGLDKNAIPEKSRRAKQSLYVFPKTDLTCTAFSSRYFRISIQG